MGVEKESIVDRATEVCLERGVVYGDPSIMCRLVAQMWTTILRSHFGEEAQQDIPPYLVGLMMAALKIYRASVPFDRRDDDSYVDLVNYVEFARTMDPALDRRD